MRVQPCMRGPGVSACFATKVLLLSHARRSLQEEEQQLSFKVPLPVNRLIRVQQWLKERSAEMEAEKAALEGRQMVSKRGRLSASCIAEGCSRKGCRCGMHTSCHS
jgi:hypothetical protein